MEWQHLSPLNLNWQCKYLNLFPHKQPGLCQISTKWDMSQANM
jgi:hypothetical protein